MDRLDVVVDAVFCAKEFATEKESWKHCVAHYRNAMEMLRTKQDLIDEEIRKFQLCMQIAFSRIGYESTKEGQVLLTIFIYWRQGISLNISFIGAIFGHIHNKDGRHGIV